MSTFLKIVVCTNVMLAGFLTNNLFAQCSTTKTTKYGITTIQTHEQYEYLRTATQYYGLSIKTILITKAGSAGYKVIVNYTGSTLVNQPINLSFKLTDGYVLNGRMKLGSMFPFTANSNAMTWWNISGNSWTALPSPKTAGSNPMAPAASSRR